MTEKIFPILAQYINKDDTVIVGVSGGPDSTALLDLLVRFFADVQRARGNYCTRKGGCTGNIVVAHINHGIRGREALCDQKFVQELARKFKLKCFIKRAKLVGQSSMEEKGRVLRREFFEKLRKKHNARWIVTAHTLDDQVETIILNFLRGSGVSGLAGMEEVNGFYLKPLLEITKKEIMVYLKKHKLNFCRDHTNEDTCFSRNFVRKKVVPILEKLNPSLKKTLTRNAAIFRDIETWLESEAADFLHAQKKYFKKRGAIFVSRNFLKLPAALQQEVIQSAFKKWSGQPYKLSAVKIEEILRLTSRNVGKKKIPLGNLGNGGHFYLDKGIIYLG